MAAIHSDRACKLCKQRRVKCDKTLPMCQRCSKLGRTCPGYTPRQNWHDQSREIREKFAHARTSSSRTPPPHSAETTALSSPLIEYGFSDNQSGADSVSQRASARTTPGRHLMIPAEHNEPFQMNSAPSVRTTGSTSSPNFTSVPASAYGAAHISTAGLAAADYEHIANPISSCPGDHSESAFFDLDIEDYYANGNNACGFFPGVAVIQTGTEGAEMNNDAQSSSRLESPSMDISDADSFRSREDTGQEREIALLMRLFVDVLAPWMDVFDMDAYFTRVLPTKATFDVLLRLALAAVAAKQTARYVFSQRPALSSRHYAFVLDIYQNASPGEWFYKAASYYDRGISYLRTRLQRCTSSDKRYTIPALACHTSISPTQVGTTPYAMSTPHRPNQEVADPNLQNLLSAISVFSLYETLDDCKASSSQHLPGFLALLHRPSPSSPPHSLATISLHGSDIGSQAAFWYFARKELLSSYANHTETRLDPDDIDLWVSSGLPVQAHHMLWSDDEASYENGIQSWQNSEGQECASYVLIWLATHVVNLVAAESQQNTGHVLWAHRTEYRQAQSSPWIKLRRMLSWWYNNRSQVFQSYAVTEIKPIGARQGTTLKAKFFTCSTGAAALQLYHFVQTLLLLNLPHDALAGATMSNRLRMLKRHSDEAEYHSREVCAIALGSPPFAVQRQMLYPLQLAGSYFDAQDDRKAILELLKGAVEETSSPIEDVVQALRMQWEQNDQI